MNGRALFSTICAKDLPKLSQTAQAEASQVTMAYRGKAGSIFYKKGGANFVKVKFEATNAK